MPTPEVIEKVRHLRAELAKTRPDTVEAANVAKHINRVLVNPGQAPPYEGLRDRLLSATADLESHHPQLANSMKAVINALSAAGV
ncbi:MAG TPA: DUF4404 family protein [Kofleriaceae bacterium]|jgi:hypothetical protein|nr:DUF4404 family protein [Kofleriaceae bacterium]